MKHFFLTILFLLPALLSNAQIKTIWTSVLWDFKGIKVDSVVYGNSWSIADYYTYDDQGRITCLYQKGYEGDETFSRYCEDKIECQYNNDGNLLYNTHMCRYNTTGDWRYAAFYFYKYDNDGRYTGIDYATGYYYYVDTCLYSNFNRKIITFHYFGDDPNLPLRSVVTSTYDDSHLLIQRDSCVKDSAGDINYRYEYQYNNEGKKTQYTVARQYGSTWTYENKYVYTYGDYGSYEKLIYSADGDAWIRNEKYIWKYDEHYNLIDSDTYEWNGTEWVKTIDCDYKYTYNEDGNPLTVEQHDSVSVLGMLLWDTYKKSELTYDDSKIIQRNYIKNNDTWDADETCTYYYTKKAPSATIAVQRDDNANSDTRKVLVNGRIYIQRGTHRYDLNGVEQ